MKYEKCRIRRWENTFIPLRFVRGLGDGNSYIGWTDHPVLRGDA